MSRILHIETSADFCSVAIAENGILLSQRETKVERSHASALTVFISETIKETSFSLEELDAIAVSKGPGSYTGLRIGVSSAKGLCYALDKPLIALNTLQSLADFAGRTIRGIKCHNDTLSQANEILEKTNNIPSISKENILLCPMLDARTLEVYAAIYNTSNKQIRETGADIVDENTYLSFLEKTRVLFFGPGAAKCRALIRHENALFADNIYPSASFMAANAAVSFDTKNFEDVAYFEPYYLKDFAGGVPVKKN